MIKDLVLFNFKIQVLEMIFFKSLSWM